MDEDKAKAEKLAAAKKRVCPLPAMLQTFASPARCSAA